MNPLRHRNWSAAIVCLAVSLGPTSATAAGFKCWTNNEGIKECGSSIPPEYAQQSSEKIDPVTGNKVTTSRAKTDEEVALEKAETERLEKEEAEKKRKAAEKAAHDRVLLATFTTEQDLFLARDEKLASIDSRVTHTAQIVKKLETNLAEMHDKAAKQELSGKTVSDKLKSDIAKVQARIEKNRGFIDLRHEEREELLATFEADLKRYRQLKGTN